MTSSSSIDNTTITTSAIANYLSSQHSAITASNYALLTSSMIGNNTGVNTMQGSYNSSGYTNISSSNVLTLLGLNNKELVRINSDGTVTWQDNVMVDEAANSFARALNIGAEKAAGITYGVKQRMRDTVFEEIISMAKEKGSLTYNDLTYLWQAAKIMDKLKGKE